MAIKNKISRRRRITEQQVNDDGVLMVSKEANIMEPKKVPRRISKVLQSQLPWLNLLAFLLIGLPLAAYFIFVCLRRGLRSRPAWIYGNPTVDDLSSCLINESTSAIKSSPRVLWEWHNHSSTILKNDLRHHPKVLIAQYSGFGEYAKFLNLISPIHQRYSQDKGYDYLIVQGTLLDFPGVQQDCNPSPRATFNKIPLLELAIAGDEYEYALILDTDAMIVNVEIDMPSLLKDDNLLAAQRVWKYDWQNTWDINAGVTLWNLRHPLASTVVQRWKHLSLYGSASDTPNHHQEDILKKNDDQSFLQTALMEYPWWKRPVVSLMDEFNYYQGTVIKHFKRDKRSWSTNGLEQRLQRVQDVIQQDLCGSNTHHQRTEYCHLSNGLTDYSQRQPPSVSIST
jgi:hypothetical protein